jgi:hypothetical protein
MATRNLGLVKAIYVGNNPPSNTDLLWRDTSLPTPLHKFYNTSTSSWEAFIYSVLIDNVTIKKNASDQLYVDISEIPNLVIEDGSITLQKLTDVATSSVFYRKTAGDGSPEVQSLAVLKEDLGLQGINTGDQDLTPYVLKITTVNGKALTGNIILTASDVGAPSGSGTSTGINTGDESNASILNKLGIVSISGINTGDQNAVDVPVEDIADYFIGTDVEAVLKELFEAIPTDNGVKTIELPTSTTIQGRINGAIEGIDYQTGWVLTAIDTVDLQIVHNLDRKIAGVTVWEQTVDGYRQKFGNAAFSGILAVDSNTVKIEALATVEAPIRIQLTFA